MYKNIVYKLTGSLDEHLESLDENLRNANASRYYLIRPLSFSNTHLSRFAKIIAFDILYVVTYESHV